MLPHSIWSIPIGKPRSKRRPLAQYKSMEQPLDAKARMTAWSLRRQPGSPDVTAQHLEQLPICCLNCTEQPQTRRSARQAVKELREWPVGSGIRSEEHTSELQSLRHLVC